MAAAAPATRPSQLNERCKWVWTIPAQLLIFKIPGSYGSVDPVPLDPWNDSLDVAFPLDA